MNHFPKITLGLVALTLMSFVLPRFGAALIFDRGAMGSGELWRLFTGHLVHFTPTHLGYNLMVFIPMAWLLESQSSKGFAGLIISWAGGMGMALWALEPNLHYYGGLSGMICAGIAYLALGYTREKAPIGILAKLALVLLLGKIILEFRQGGSILPHGANPKFVPLPLVHALGMAVGLVTFFLGPTSHRIGPDT